MTNLLLRLFIHKKADISTPKGRSLAGRLSGIVGIFCNLILFAAKIIVGTLSGSVSITADAINNLSDASSAIITLIGFKLAEKPADDAHPYGHARFEYLSGLAVAAIIIVIGFELAQTSVRKIFNPSDVDFTIITATVLIFSMLIKGWMALFNRKLGKLIDSQALHGTSIDSRNDVISTGAVLIAATIEHFTSLHIDGFMGLAVAIFILYSGAMLAKDTISPIIGEAASSELKHLIADTVRSNPKVLGYHDLMVHDYGPGQRFASMHIEMDQKENPMLCHEIIDDLERECYLKHNVHLVIHYDPVIVGDQALESVRMQITQILNEYDERLTFHDLRMVCGRGHTNLIFDIALPYDLTGREKDIKEYLDSKINAASNAKYYTVINFDPAAFN